LSELIGIIPRSDDNFEVDPIIPSSWKYFIAENILYHGHNITVLYDQDGTRYKEGSGMKVYVNGKVAASQANVGKMIVPVPHPIIPNENYKRIENYAANLKSTGYPKPSASSTHATTSIWQAIDGRIIYDYVPSNRWYDYDSKNDNDWFAVDFGRAKTVNTVSLYIYDDVITKQGVTECPTKMNVQYHDGTDWKDVQNQVFDPVICSGNDRNVINFKAVNTRQIRVVFTRNKAKNYYVGITEFEVWGEWPQTSSPNTYEAEDAIIHDALVESSTTASGHSYVGMIDKPSSIVEFSGIYSESAGTYTLRIHYANANSTDSKQRIHVNYHLFDNVVKYPLSKHGWGHFDDQTFVEIKVPLLRGNNVIYFYHSVGFAELDKIQVIF